MRLERGTTDSCRHCDERIVWQRPELLPMMKKENAEVRAEYEAKIEAYHNSIRVDGERAPYPGGLQLPYREYGYGADVWLHKGRFQEYTEKESVGLDGQSKIELEFTGHLCKDFKTEWSESPRRGKWQIISGTKATPKGRCTQRTNDGAICYRKVNEESGEHRMCGLHWRKMAEYLHDREVREQQQQIREWQRAELERYMTTIREDYGLEVEEYYGAGLKVVVDAKELVKVLENTLEESFTTSVGVSLDDEDEFEEDSEEDPF